MEGECIGGTALEDALIPLSPKRKSASETDTAVALALPEPDAVGGGGGCMEPLVNIIGIGLCWIGDWFDAKGSGVIISGGDLDWTLADGMKGVVALLL